MILAVTYKVTLRRRKAGTWQGLKRRKEEGEGIGLGNRIDRKERKYKEVTDIF